MQKIYNKSLGYFDLPKVGGSSKDLEYLASGGQADIFVTKDKKYAFKVYHDSSQSIPEDKIKELSSLKDSYIITPIDLLYENQYVGYFMKYLRMNYTLQELFPKAFKNRNNLDIQRRKELIEKLIDLVAKVHNHDFLIVDLNARNIVVDKKLSKVYLIDTDSYQTKKYKATAIQESIRDPLVKNNNFTKESDWFSFACLAFELYTNIHPYGGMHPSFNKEVNGQSVIEQRLKNKVSVFNNEVKYPPMAVEDFNIIPKNHLNWFKDVFEKNQRSTPPKADGSAAQSVPNQFVIIKSNSKLNTDLLMKFNSVINKCYFIKGNFAFKTKNSFIINGIEDKSTKNRIPTLNSNGTIALGELKSDIFSYKTVDLPYDYIDSIDGSIYRMKDNRLFIDTIFENSSVFCRSTPLGTLTETSKLGQSMVFERCLNANRVVVLQHGKTRQIFLDRDLNSYTLIDGQATANFALLVAQKRNNYYKILIDLKTNKYILSNSKFFYPNLIELNNGLAIKLEGSSISVFKDLNRIKKIDDTGLDDGCKLITDGISVYFYSDNCFYKTSLK